MTTTSLARSRKDYIVLYLKGVAMGAADVVPGVSGGTVAFISGIYDELVRSIRSVGPQTLKTLRKEGVGAAWSAINGWFLLTVVAGVFTSLLTLSKVVGYLLTNHPLPLWAFFFGLILGSIVYLMREHPPKQVSLFIAFIVGSVIAYGISLLPTQQIEPTLIIMFFAGALALCAMILPGISGSFILLLLGLYGAYIDALKTLDIVVLATFITGGLLGLLSFSRVLSWLLDTYHECTVLTMTGFLAGSLVMIWPWRNATEVMVSDSGKTYYMAFENVLPQQYAAITGYDPQTMISLSAMAVGFILVISLEWFGQKAKSE